MRGEKKSGWLVSDDFRRFEMPVRGWDCKPGFSLPTNTRPPFQSPRVAVGGLLLPFFFFFFPVPPPPGLFVMELFLSMVPGWIPPLGPPNLCRVSVCVFTAMNKKESEQVRADFVIPWGKKERKEIPCSNIVTHYKKKQTKKTIRFLGGFL